MSATWGKLSNEDYLQGIRTGDSKVLNSIYQEFQPGILQYIIRQGGSEAEAKDIFANAIIVILRKVRGPGLELTSPFSAYLRAVCRNLWLKTFRTKKRTVGVTDEMERGFVDDSLTPDAHLEKTVLHQLIREVFIKLGEDCQKIIQMRWDGQSYAHIREEMGFGSEGYARKRKHVCYERLMGMVKDDPRIAEFFN
ncbi:MAG: sigma-70 family RNA polymerase sigma factor [Saprospiraceae bacterium]|nr:sigma-70 family RNA polymerase sigma factor [Saprospiraceae bacterium]